MKKKDREEKLLFHQAFEYEWVILFVKEEVLLLFEENLEMAKSSSNLPNAINQDLDWEN